MLEEMICMLENPNTIGNPHDSPREISKTIVAIVTVSCTLA